MAINRDIKYLNKDFSDFRSQLINFSQTYFPTTYTDFSPSSPGVMFMEQASYVGDILSFYLDNQLQETYLQYVRQTNNIYDLAYMFGYKPKTTGLSTVDLDFFQLVPAKTEGSTKVPDYDYALFFDQNTQVTSTTNSSISFNIEDPIDFSVSNSLDPTTVTIAQISAGEPTYFLLKKTRKATSGAINTTTFSFGDFQEFPTATINSLDIADVIDVFDSDGNQYYEVDYLGQETVFDSIKNTNINDPNNYLNSNDTPYILKTKQVQRRFTTRFLNSGSLQIQFGSGNPSDTDEEIIPNPSNVGIGLPYEKNKLTTAYSPTNFIFTNTYGIAPSNTTLTVRYLTGGGVTSNVPANNITSLNTSTVRFLNNNLNSVTAQYIFDSVAVNNSRAASGGKDGESAEEIRQNALANFNSQLRNVTADDYLVRTLSMPSKYGIISKAYSQKPKINEGNNTLDIYVLSYNVNKNLTTASTALKNNLKTYLNQYRIIGDSIGIKDAFIINIAVDFEIITSPNFNNNEVLTRCITELQNYFNIDNWQVNQPILLKDIELLLDKVNGVQTVNKILISNKAGTSSGYSQYAYDIDGATQGKIIYPSIDPSIFEVKFPNQDIKGKVVTI
jgi:hypothetical protein